MEEAGLGHANGRCHHRFALCNVIGVIKNKLDSGPFPLVEIVIDINICFELKIISNDLLTPLDSQYITERHALN